MPKNIQRAALSTSAVERLIQNSSTMSGTSRPSRRRYGTKAYRRAISAFPARRTQRPPNMRLKDAIDMVFVGRGELRSKKETSKGYETDARQLCVALRNPEIINVRLEDVERYLLDMENAGFSRNSIVHKACAFRTLFRELRRHGHIVINPDDIPIPRKDFKEPHVATDEDIQKVLEVISESPQRHGRFRNKAILLLLRDTGMRIGELRSMNVQDLDLENKRARIKTEKTRGMVPFRNVFWEDECNGAIKEWLEERKLFLKERNKTSEALFICNHRDTGVGRIGKTAINIAFRKASWVAGIPTLNPHSLRHRKGHKLASNGANNSVISKVLGHSTLASSFVYTQLNDKETEVAARKYGAE